ncbi:MAG: YIP1 family protein [Candidatus Methanogasteraceae archaeon]
MANVLTNPDGFFSELSVRDVNLLMPTGIVLIVATITAISLAMMFSATAPTLPEEAAAISGMSDMLPVICVITGILVPFIMWYLYTGVFYVISIFFGGEGSFKRCLEFVGYGFIPMIVSSLIGLVISLTMPPAIDFSSVDPKFIEQTLMQDPATQVSTIIGIPFLLWSANICIFAVKHARNLSARNALITVGVPVGLHIIDTTIKMI